MQALSPINWPTLMQTKVVTLLSILGGALNDQVRNAIHFLSVHSSIKAKLQVDLIFQSSVFLLLIIAACAPSE